MSITKKTIVVAVSTAVIAIASSGADITRQSVKNEHSTLNGGDEGREKFEGVFGHKFGEQVAVDEKDCVWGFDMNFYRMRFEAEKQSLTFTKYYLWVSKVTHKVFAIEACSSDDLSDALVTALEKKYKAQFTNSGQSYEMLFPKEACSLMLFKKTTCTTYLKGFVGEGGSENVYSVDGSKFGSDTLWFTKWPWGFAVAKSDELFEMAKRESQIDETERVREEQLREKLKVQLEADNAVDAF